MREKALDSIRDSTGQCEPACRRAQLDSCSQHEEACRRIPDKQGAQARTEGHRGNGARGQGAHKTVSEVDATQRPPLTWPLMLCMAVCVLVFLGGALQVYASAPAFVLFSIGSLPLGWLAMAPLALVLLASSFTFARILRRRSTVAARLYLMGVYAMSGAALIFEWYQSAALDAASVLWLAFIAGLFFLIRPVTPNHAMGVAE